MRRYATLTGRRRLIVKVPVLTPKLSSLWLGLVTDLPTSVGRPLVDGLSVEVIAGDDRIRSLVPFTLLGYDDAVRLAVARTLSSSRPTGMNDTITITPMIGSSHLSMSGIDSPSTYPAVVTPEPHRIPPTTL